MTANRKTVLIVDDEWAICELLADHLRDTNLRVISANNADEFREKAFSERPDLILLDIMLGNSNGVDVYNRLLAGGLDKNIPVIFMSALADGHPQDHAVQGRHYALYSKPFDTDNLVREIHSFVGA
ncbi:MAG: response regulator [Candidatus Omnitrophota bacterium]|nr:response regulator [Candidatus Omnitrophota bacterium]